MWKFLTRQCLFVWSLRTNPDQTLLDIHEMILWLQDNGYKVNRYQMASSPQAFTSNSEVKRLVREKQMAACQL